MTLIAPWEITVVEKATLGGAARMAAVGTKKAKPVANAAGRKAAVKTAQPSTGPMPGQKSRMDSVKIRSPRRTGIPSWANRAPGDVGPHLNMEQHGFKMLTGGSGGGGKSLVPTRTLSGGGMTPPPGGPASGAGPRKRGLAVPGAIGVGAGITAGAGFSVAQHKTAPKKKKVVIKGLTATLGKPMMKKPGGALKPVQPPKPAMGAKPMTSPTGAKPMATPKAPTPVTTLRPPSMMPPKPGTQPVKPR